MARSEQSNGVTKTNNDSNKKRIGRQLPDKVFEIRNSLLTDLFETDPHIKTLRHICYATLLYLLVNTILHDFYIANELKVGMHLFYRGFGKFYIVIPIWLLYHVACSIMFVCFNVWARVRMNLPPKNMRIWDTLWSSVLVIYYFLSFRIPPLLITYFALPEASAAVILAEQVRLLMKQHAFVRENMKKVVSYKPHGDTTYTSSKYGQFFYFLFAPTIVYRDEYPRTKSINWNYALTCFMECVATILFFCFVLIRFINPLYEDIGLRKHTYHEILVSVFSTGIPSVLLLIIIFYLVLHSFQNFFAEILRFGDRQFYKDWWNCCSYQEYFRTWNIIVHDWLYAYIYKDVYEVLTNGNKHVAKLVVFVVSAAVHEYLMYATLGFFFPVMFVQFFTAALVSFVPTPKTNFRRILFWFGLIIGCGTLTSMYTLEFYARYNLPKEEFSWTDLLVPKWTRCQNLE